MRNPLEIIGDFYDHQVEYYRWFVHRRLLFSEMTFESVKNNFKFNIFENHDSENVSKLIQQTTYLGLSTGVSLAPFKYLSITQRKSNLAKKGAVGALGVILFCTASGLVYGTVVNAVSNYRGNKNSPANHFIAGMLTFPAMGVYAKSNKMVHGFYNGLILAGLAALLKGYYTGNFISTPPTKIPEGMYPRLPAAHFKA